MKRAIVVLQQCFCGVFVYTKYGFFNPLFRLSQPRRPAKAGRRGSSGIHNIISVEFLFTRVAQLIRDTF